MKKTFTLTALLVLLGQQLAMACDVCKTQQPKGFENITHGAGPKGSMDWVILAAATIVVLATVYLCVKYLAKPEKNCPDHIKNIVLNEGF